MTNGNQLRAVMFADVSGSSALYKQAGNQQAKAIIDGAITLMTTETLAHNGVVVKTIGDEIMARFDCASDACQTAMAIQYKCARSAELYDLSIRIGMDFGPTLLDNNDVFGNTVNDAAFIAHISRGKQILLSGAMVDALEQAFASLCQEFDSVQIKGHSSKSTIYRLQWQAPAQSQSETTVMSISALTQKLNDDALVLTSDNQTITITPDQTPFIIGRDTACTHLHVSVGLASREHCHIVYRRGKYVLVDNSTNGTFVTQANQSEIYLRREELPLMSTGSFSIGQSAQQSGVQIITYTTKK